MPEDLDAAPWGHLSTPTCADSIAEAGFSRVKWHKPKAPRRLRARGRTTEDGTPLEDVFCHVPQALTFNTGPTGATWSGHMMVNCRMALALARFERIAQEETKRVFGPKHRVTRLRQFGTYNCRRIKAWPLLQSEHSFGNAIDIGKLHVSGFGWVDVKRHWNPRWPSQQAASDLLRAIATRLLAEQVFTNVLTPDYNEAHRNHFHFDLAPR